MYILMSQQKRQLYQGYQPSHDSMTSVSHHRVFLQTHTYYAHQHACTIRCEHIQRPAE